MIRNVSLGHGLFDLIRQERMAKKTAAMLEKQKKLELARNMWQPPKRDSETEEESDDDIIQDDDRYSSGENSQARQSGKASSKKKKALIPRPYTPQHNSLIDVPELVEDETSQHALFRQLCVLNWILDAMNVEQGYTMSHIMTCWSHNEIGGTKVTVRKAQQEKQTETKWERFLSTPGKVSFKFV
ncbi:coiled-coil domain-containing protein 60-like isoform X2 [Littorina saxatilis]|uniref:coiled-coil domain-containing protein 60-like isoform X2 n=1 Tax=Littorina saxatilis TaxID=31220 RepID=UPI0038B5B90F